MTAHFVSRNHITNYTTRNFSSDLKKNRSENNKESQKITELTGNSKQKDPYQMAK